MEWLLEPKTFKKMQDTEIPSAEILAQSQTELPDIMSIVGNTARININGVLTDARSWFCAIFFGNTVYAEIIDSVKIAVANPEVKDIEFNINSPGGMASAQWIEAMDVIANISKPTKAIVGTMAASAAFGLASQADEIIAQNRMSYIGSVGVVATYVVWDEIVEITSTQAPKKRPNVKTEEGVKIVKEEIDPIHDIFVDAIAKGRKITAIDVNSNFGQGALLIAQEAIKRGMIDKIGIDNSENNLTNPTEANMDLKQLQKDYPALCAEIKTEGIEDGIKKERSRVTAHLILGKAAGAGAIEIAHEAIKDGTSASDEITVAKYTSARLDATDIDIREKETEKAEVELKAEKEESNASLVADVVEEKLGVGGK